MLQVNNYSISVEGIQLTYQNGHGEQTIVMEPRPSCEVLKSIGVINGFKEDENNEPIVYIRDQRKPWYEVAKLFSIDTALPKKIAEYHSRHLEEFEL